MFIIVGKQGLDLERPRRMDCINLEESLGEVFQQYRNISRESFYPAPREL